MSASDKGFLMGVILGLATVAAFIGLHGCAPTEAYAVKPPQTDSERMTLQLAIYATPELVLIPEPVTVVERR